MTSYSEMKRYPVFSQDELICNMSTATNLNPFLLDLVYDDLLGMVQNERNLRRQVLEHGVINSQNVLFNTLPDDERQCDYCKTTCYLSALTCECEENKLVCLQHIKELCKRCPSDRFILKYTFKLDELVTLLRDTEAKLNTYEKLSLKLKRTVSLLNGQSGSMSNGESKIELKELVKLKDRSIEMNISENTKTMRKLNERLKEAMILQKRINNLLDKPNLERLTIDEFKSLIDNVTNLNISLDRVDELIDLYEAAVRLVNEVKELSQPNKKIDGKLLNNLTNSDARFRFLNLDEFSNDEDNDQNVNKSPSKRKRLNRLSNMMSPSIRNSAF